MLFQERLSYQFREPELLRRSLIHPSFAAEQSPPGHDNQRLEFLGDAVLQLLVTDALFRKNPNMAEGELTRIRSSLTNENALVRFAKKIDLGNYLFLGRGEERAGGRERASVLADAFEAVIGALYLDGGISAAKAFCESVIEEPLEDIEMLLAADNPKGTLQELTQSIHKTTPAYEVVKISGPEHDPEFQIRLTIKGMEVATAKAGNRKIAEKRAAAVALRRLAEEEIVLDEQPSEINHSDESPL